MSARDRRARYRVLLADDDPTLRSMLRDGFAAAGYDVEAVEDGDAAQEAYSRRCPDVLIADLVMPGLTGDALASACKQDCHDTKLVFMSGYDEQSLHERDIRQAVFIPKPFEMAQLIRYVDRLLGIGEAPQE